MSKSTKVWLITAASLVIIGLIMFAVVMTVYDWDFRKLNTIKYQTSTVEINEPFTDISIKTDTANISFAPSEDGKCKVVCYEPENANHSVKVNDSSLCISVTDNRKWYEYIGINFDETKITVYIPQGEYGALTIKSSTGDVEIPKEFKFKSMDILQSTGDITCKADVLQTLKIKTSTGDIRLKNITAQDVKLTVSTGDININNIKCEKFVSNSSTGEAYLKKVIATDEINIETSTGDVELDACDAGELYIKTSTGDVSGTLLSEKSFVADTDTGYIDIPKTSSGGRCEIETSTDDIELDIES